MAELDDHVAAASAFADVSRAMLCAAAGTGTAELKPDRTFVTATDKAIEQRLRQLIADRFPQHGIWGEEFGRHQPDAEWQWILDPIDGTAQFIAGIPVYATLIALARGGVPVVGVMDFPAAGERWIGCQGRPTSRNGGASRTSGACDLAAAVMSTSSPDFYSDAERPAFEALRRATRWRIYGGSALSYGRLAGGRIDLACDSGLHIYDFACFRPIIEGAGGVVTDWDGQPLTLASGPRVLAAATRDLHSTARRIVNAR
jgi:inositol-phosphate phosphatase / L-galactose 1-phosphate phosphatase / histidinol-phosphatase